MQEPYNEASLEEVSVTKGMVKDDKNLLWSFLPLLTVGMELYRLIDYRVINWEELSGFWTIFIGWLFYWFIVDWDIVDSFITF